MYILNLINHILGTHFDSRIDASCNHGNSPDLTVLAALVRKSEFFDNDSNKPRIHYKNAVLVAILPTQ
jgi:hypothetical protein